MKMFSLLYKPLLKRYFPNIILEKRLRILLFILFMQLELAFLLIENHYLYYLLIYVLVFESISDYYSLEIYSLFNYLLMMIGIMNINNFSIYNLLIPLCLYILAYMNLLGMGDSEIYLVLSLYFNYEQLVYILFISSLLSSIYILINKKDKIALVPFITLSTFIIILYNCIH